MIRCAWIIDSMCMDHRRAPTDVPVRLVRVCARVAVLVGWLCGSPAGSAGCARAGGVHRVGASARDAFATFEASAIHPIERRSGGSFREGHRCARIRIDRRALGQDT